MTELGRPPIFMLDRKSLVVHPGQVHIRRIYCVSDASPARWEEEADMKKYIVRDGETMWNVSKVTGVRLNLLMAANPQVHDPNHLQAGSVLSIPELGKESAKPASTPEYTGTGAGPKSGGLHAHGTAKTTPGGGGVPPAPGQSPSHTASTAPYFGFVWPHVVQPGESWDTVAGMYNVPVDSLRRMNPSQTSGLQPGDVVYVPGSAGQVPGTVPVQPGPNGSQAGSQTPWGWPWPMPGYSGGGVGAMPQMPGYGAQWPAPPTYPQGDGPNTHNPIRNTWYDNMTLPPYPVYVPAVPNTHGNYGVPMRNLNGADWNGTELQDSQWQDSASTWRADRESDGTFVYREGTADGAGSATNEVPRRPSATWHWPDVASENGPSSGDLPDAEG